MDTSIGEREELKQMQERILKAVNSQEVCWGCQRVCECEQWLANETVALWLCADCVFEAWHRLETESMAPLSLSTCAQ